MTEQTLLFLKPDMYETQNIGNVIQHIEANKELSIRAMKMVQLNKAQAETFYAIHKERPFFDSLTAYVSRGPIVALLLEGENAVQKARAMMGATNPENADEGTIRKKYGQSLETNAVHGSDSTENAEIEKKFFFPELF